MKRKNVNEKKGRELMPSKVNDGSRSKDKDQCPTDRVFQYWVGSGRVLDKIPGSGSGSGRVGMLKYMIGYFRVSLLFPGISFIFGYFGYFRVCWVFSGISGFTHIYQGYFLTLMRSEKIATKPNWF